MSTNRVFEQQVQEQSNLSGQINRLCQELAAMSGEQKLWQYATNETTLLSPHSIHGASANSKQSPYLSFGRPRWESDVSQWQRQVELSIQGIAEKIQIHF